MYFRHYLHGCQEGKIHSDKVPVSVPGGEDDELAIADLS